MFTKKSTPAFVKIDGTVTIDGKPVEYVTAGMYSYITDKNTSPRKIEITTTSGQTSSFTIEPYKNPIKLISINGQTNNISIDITKDVVLELESAELSENKLLKVSLAINQVSIKSLYEVCYTHTGMKVTIPAAAFRNLNIKPGGDALYNYKKSYLSVGFESMENATAVSGAFPTVQYAASYSDGKFVNVTGEPVLNPGLTAKGKEVNMDYNFFKPNAFLSRPFSQLKKIGVLSFSIRGTTYKEVVDVSQYETSQATATTTTTTILTFPQQPNEVWDAVLAKMYPDLMAIIKSEFNASVLPVEATTGTPAYKTIEAFSKDDANTKVEFTRAYKNTKVVSAFMPIIEGFGVNIANDRIMKESESDALITLTLDLEVSEDKKSDLVLMVPKLAFELVGKTNGLAANTKYCTGNIKSSAGVSFTNNITPDNLDKIIRRTDLLIVFRKAIKEIIAQEKSNGDYDVIWNLQK